VEEKGLDVPLVEFGEHLKLEFVHSEMLQKIVDDHDELHYHMSKIKQLNGNFNFYKSNSP